MRFRPGGRLLDDHSSSASILQSAVQADAVTFPRLPCFEVLLTEHADHATRDALILEYTQELAKIRNTQLPNASKFIQLFEESSNFHSNSGRPCGYVFQRGDIAWNCRTCQHDATCVICDDCFQASDHTGHEVFFHRTTPGGCCDCGDLEAWAPAGCCAKHRPGPTAPLISPTDDDAMERLLETSKQTAERAWEGMAEVLPPLVKAVVRSCLSVVCQTVQRSAEAADADYCTAGSLRLHNDDVHTFEEVIDALQKLACEKPNELTQKVDSEGQVLTNTYDTKEAIFSAFEKFKSHGLQCATVTPELEQQEGEARMICNYLTDLANAHTAVASAIVEALVADLSLRTVPDWDRNGTLDVQDDSSYLTQVEQYNLFQAAFQLAGDRFLADVGVDATFYQTPVLPKYPKSPHALWGTLPGNYAELLPQHPLLDRYRNTLPTGIVKLSDPVYVIDTDLRKQQEGDLLASAVYPYALPGLHKFDHHRCMEWRHLLAAASFRAPLSPLLWLLLLDPYPPKQLRGSIHALFLSVLNVGCFKAKFAGALAVAYRPLSTLYCAGIGTDADTPLHFTVQIFTAGSLVRALQHGPSVEALLKMDNEPVGEIGIFVPPISHCIARCVHTNLLGATKEVGMLLNNSTNTQDLIYVAGEHPVFTLLPAAPDDGFLDARSTRHKRLQYVLRDLEYVLETSKFVWDDVFAGVWCRMTRLSQGMDPQKRRISGGHVEYETTRWLEAFGLSLTMIQTFCTSAPALLREIKMWLYREGILQTGLLDSDAIKMEALQRSTLHCGSLGLACATGVKMSESQLSLFENVTVDWLRVPHSPMAGDALSFHLPLHRALAKCIFHSLTEKSVPFLDEIEISENSLVSILKPTIRPQNCRVVWSTGPDCSTQEAQRRRSRSRHIGGLIAAAKVIHSLADHPIRCLAASLQIERHLWARNGSSVAGMAMNYSSAPLCRSFRDLDLFLVQFSAAGMSCGMGVRRVFDLLLSRFNVEGYLVDPERKANGSWVNPPRLQDPEHAAVLAECFMQLVCVLVTELPAVPSQAVERGIRRELVHALAAEPRTHSEAIAAASHGATRKDENEGIFRETFSRVLKEVGKQKGATSRTGPPVFELQPTFCDEYDPTFFHLRRNEHQHAMDVISRMRKQKLGADFELCSLPLVCPPPKAHARFLPCRLMLHLDALNASLRRSLLYALTNGSWLPPSEPEIENHDLPYDMDISSSSGDVSATVFKARSRTPGKRQGGQNPTSEFSQTVVSSSSISFSEVLQLLTLQAHTLEECASLHRKLPNLDEESRILSANLSIHSYLDRLVYVPDSLRNCWALQPYPKGPLRSNGSGLNRGSILGLLVALYEHRADHGAQMEGNTKNDEDHVGAKSLVSSGLKWLLRFISAIIEGAPTVSAAYQAASTGVRLDTTKNTGASWMIGSDLESLIRGMLNNLPDLWPKSRDVATPVSNSGAKGKEAMKRKQQEVMEMMRRKQERFAQTIQFDNGKTDETEEQETCIICRCDDADGENNGPLGYLGHVQRSRGMQLRVCKEIPDNSNLSRAFRVVGHMGCMLREAHAMDSKSLACLPKGSIVEVLQTKVGPNYDLLSRRVLVRHESVDLLTGAKTSIEGWASVQSSQGYVILSPLRSLCFQSSRWGPTRPIIMQCGHAAHLKCVETHTLSLHHRAAGDQPYDGRFAANIGEGEFLCPLCKQLSNILVPRDTASSRSSVTTERSENPSLPIDQSLLRKFGRVNRTDLSMSRMERKALEDFGSNLYNAMNVPWERSLGERAKKQAKWHPLIQKWDYEDTDTSASSVGSILRRFRQQLISWAAVGHSASSLEAGARGVEEVLPFGTMSQTSDPWTEFSEQSMDSHPLLLELKRSMASSAGLLRVLRLNMCEMMSSADNAPGQPRNVVGECLANALDGSSWIDYVAEPSFPSNQKELKLWSEVTALVGSLPCHLSRDGALFQRCEARATAAAMWAIKGLGSEDAESAIDPPAPFAIQQLFVEGAITHPPIANGWGTLDPQNDPKIVPFRPAIASSFLYLPLLSWDLNIFAGAAFSSLLSAEDASELPDADELSHLAHRLLVARIIQAITTPGGLILPDEMDLEDDDEPAFEGIEKEREGQAIVDLVAHCRALLASKSLSKPNRILKAEGGEDLTHSATLAGVGQSILPFARSIILLLRACVAVVRERQEVAQMNHQPSGTETKLNSVLTRHDIMTTEEGWSIVKALDCPLPSNLVSGPWFDLLNRWLGGIISLEIHHGCRGRSLFHPGISKSIDSQPQVDKVINDSASKSSHVFSDESTDGMEIDEGLDQPMVHGSRNDFLMVQDDEEDEELADIMGEAEEMVSFDIVQGDPVQADSGENGDSDDEGSDVVNNSMVVGGESQNVSSSRFANLSRSPILPFQPSLLGISEVGLGKHKSAFDFSTANKVMADLSHLGSVHKKHEPTFTLVRLPKSFVELYNLVNKVKRRDASSGAEENDDGSSSETAICLLTGTIMNSGSDRRSMHSRMMRPPGACTMHARKTASGVGIFFLVQKCTILLMHNNKSAYSPSIYVDEHGEEDPQLRRGRPLYLNDARYRALELLWRQQGIPREVAQIRSTSDRVIRDNWY